jgi:outer membrane protein
VAGARADVVLDVDRAYFNALRAEAVLRVARRTVDARQLAVDQITALAGSNLKSGLDVSFARVNLGQAQLLLVQARNDVEAAYASLTAALGSPEPAAYELADEPMPPTPPDDAGALVAEALRHRPDIAARRFSQQAATAFAEAERRLWFPAVSAIGAAGFTPYHQAGLTDRYSALGVTVTVPLTNGNLYTARHAEAAFRAQAEEQTLRDLENRVSRDVRVAWLNVRTAFQRVDLTNQVLAQASDALDLAQARYNLGLSSIVELTQAELQKTQAEIDQATARYECLARSAALAYEVGARK